MEKKIRNIIGMLEMGVKTDEQTIAELLDLISVINRRELLIDFLKWFDTECNNKAIENENENIADKYLKSINSL